MAAFRTGIARCLLTLLLMLPALAQSAERLAGRPVAQVLRELRAPGREFIFSSALLPDEVRVVTEPTASEPLAIAREVLREHGLALAELRPGLYSVVRAPQAQPAPGASAATTETPAKPVPLEQIVITTSRYGISPDSSFLLEGSRLATQPSLADDPVRAIARLPGMAQSGTSAQSNIRGGDTSEVLILLDGFRVRQAFHLPGYQSFFSVLDSGLIREAEVFTGGFPVRYGNRLSGVFDLRTMSATSEPRRSLGLSFFNATGRVADVLEGRVSGDWLLAARMGTLRPLIEAFARDVGSPSYGDVYSRATFGSGAWRTSANILWASDELDVDSAKRGEHADVTSRSRYLWLRTDWNTGEPLSGFITVGQSAIDSVRKGFVNPPQPAIGELSDSRRATFWDVRAVGSWQPRDDHAFELGYEWSDQTADYHYEVSALYPAEVAALFGREQALERDVEVSPKHTRSALFASHRWRATHALSTEIGVRAQRLEATGLGRQWTFDPRASIRWQLDDARSVRLHWGRFHQSDEIQELLVEEATIAFRAPQRADHLILGYEQRIGTATSLRIEAFDKRQTSPRPRFENQFDTLALLPELSPDRTRIAAERAEFRGVEASFLHEATPWTYWASVTWSEAFDQFGSDDVPRGWDQRWKLNAGVDWTRGPWLLSGVLDLHTGWATTSLFPDRGGALQLGPRNEDRLPAYGSLDFRGEYRRPLALGELRLALEITNLTNRQNPCCVLLKIEPDGTLTTQSRSWLPIIPSLSIRWDF